jgi:hypothetical protein
MARRIDYYDDPEAPKANSLVPSVTVQHCAAKARHLI